MSTAIQVKRCTVTINGDTYQTRDTEFEPGGLMADNISRSDQGMVLFQQVYGLSTVRTTILATSATDLLRIKRGYNNVTVGLEFDSGAQFAIPGMVVEGDVMLSNGEIPLTLRGGDAESAG